MMKVVEVLAGLAVTPTSKSAGLSAFTTLKRSFTVELLFWISQARKVSSCLPGSSCGIGSKIVGEIAVQHVGLRHIAIYHQLQVVADTASGSIDSVLIGYLCHKERGGVDIAAIYEGRRIEIAVDGRTDGIVLLLLALAYRKLLAGAVGREGLGGIHRIEVDQTALVGIIDIQRNGKGEGKLAASYAIGALIQGLGSVFVFESLLGAILAGIVQATGNRLLGISYGSGDDAPEVVCSLNMRAIEPAFSIGRVSDSATGKPLMESTTI